MADDWDDWDDDDNKSAKGSDKSEGWDWPAAEGGSSAAALAAKQEQQRHDQSSALEEEVQARDAAVDEMTEKYFNELRKYLEDLADPSVREEINQVRFLPFDNKFSKCVQHSSSPYVALAGVIYIRINLSFISSLVARCMPNNRCRVCLGLHSYVLPGLLVCEIPVYYTR